MMRRAGFLMAALVAAPAMAETPIPVEADSLAPHFLIDSHDIDETWISVTTRRDSAATGSNYTIRAIDCAGRRSAYLAGQPALEDANAEAEATLEAGFEAWPLVDEGLDRITFQIAAFACERARAIDITD